MNIRAQLESRLSQALSAAIAEEAPAIVQPSANPKFGDYQANGVMAAARRMKRNPRELAEQVLEKLDLSDLAESVEVAGPGFINITLSAGVLADAVMRADAEARLDVPALGAGRTVVVDYSSPNLAKEMHVGHLRSTIIGDSLARVLAFLGCNVIRQNHVGDWGTQFGMLIAFFEEQRERGIGDLSIADMEAFYRQAKKRFDEDEAFAERARRTVVRLQGGDPKVNADWREILHQSLAHCRQVYDLLGVSLTDADIRGESAYNDVLPDVVAALDAAGLLTESQGAQCVFLDDDAFRGSEGEPVPVIVRKSDGGYLYATTDLAALRYRCRTLGATRILYATDARQAFHFAQIFAVARAAGFAGPEVSLEHVPFGVMLNEAGRPFKTREGGTIKLADLLNEAVQRAAAVVAEKNPDLPADQAARVARAVGIGAVKYADLSMDRTSDYKFSFDRMLSLQGNTAPYMQYAYARVQSIFRKGAETLGDLAGRAVILGETAEKELAKRLSRFEEVLAAVASESRPNILTGYLYDLAGAFSGFYETCPVLKADDATRASRLRLCDVTARTIRQGLELLGIEVIEQM
ncbi:MAG: arginine--tRNA ligase [Planctomycetes bacterium]|nr:arginine--tRNA ligase [Planctomycetota bacterium]